MPYLRPGRWMLVGLGLDTEVDQYHLGRGRPEDAGAGHGAWQKAADSALPQVPILTSPPPDHILCPGTRSCFCSASSSWWSGLRPGKRRRTWDWVATLAVHSMPEKAGDGGTGVSILRYFSRTLLIIYSHFYRTQVNLGSDLWVGMSVQDVVQT